LTYLKEFIMSAYPDTPPPEPGEDLYQWVVEQLSNLTIPGTVEPTNYFDWLSLPDNMVFRI
jgi:hypothetical protein